MISYEQNVKTVWKTWKPGFYLEMVGTVFHSVIFDKTESSLRIRLVFEESPMTQHIININYTWMPGDFNIVLDAIGKRVIAVVAEGTQDHASYSVTFDDGYWFRI